MKWKHPSPALVISLIALLLALGGTSYAAIALALPRNSVGTQQLKNGAVTSTKINKTALAPFLRYGSTLPSGATETGAWGSGYGSGSPLSIYTAIRPVSSFVVPLAKGLDADHVIYVSGSSATHCSGPGHADTGYLCVYQEAFSSANTPTSADITNVEAPGPDLSGIGPHGFAILLSGGSAGGWFISGVYAVTAP